MNDRAHYRGTLRRGETPNTIVGELREVTTGWAIEIAGTRREDGGYDVVGVLGPTPDLMRIEAIDGEKK